MLRLHYRSTIVLLLLLIASECFAGGAAIIVRRASGDTYDDLTFFWTAESTTLGGDDYSAGDTTASLSGSAAINNAVVKYGSNSLDIPAANSRAEFSPASIATFTEGYYGTWIYFESYNNDATILRLFGDSNDFFTVRQETTGTGELEVRWNGNGTTVLRQTSAANIALSTWYYVSFSYDQSTNYTYIEVDGVDASLSTNGTITAMDASPVALQYGDTTGVATNHHQDNIVWGSDSTRDVYESYQALTVSPK